MIKIKSRLQQLLSKNNLLLLRVIYWKKSLSKE